MNLRSVSSEHSEFLMKLLDIVSITLDVESGNSTNLVLTLAWVV